MLATIKGTYDHGKFILMEDPPVKTKAEVMITFLPSMKRKRVARNQKIILGLLEGKIKLSDDFNEPMEDLNEYM